METDYKPAYTVLLIRKFAEHYALQIRSAYQYLRRYKGIDFIDECYESEHLLSIEDAIADVSLICQNNGGGLTYD